MIIDATGIGDTLVHFDLDPTGNRENSRELEWMEYLRNEVRRLQNENQRLRSLLVHRNID